MKGKNERKEWKVTREWKKGKGREMRADEDRGGKTEMGSAVNIEVNRGAIGMNRSGMTLLPDLNLSESFFFSRFSRFVIQRRVKFSRRLDYLLL